MMNILVVDDDFSSRTIIQKILKQEGHTAWTAEDSQEALDILQREQVNVVISDWNMPGMTGIDLCRYLREQVSLGYIYFIIVTSRATKQDMLEGLSAGADDFLSKPIEPVELILRVRNAERVLALETTSVTLFSLAKLAESKDLETGNHLERMREYARALAEQLMKDPAIRKEVPPRFPEIIFQSSPLHDIGKVGIPDYVLLKPGSLNDEEWAIMKKHTILGAETLQATLNMYPGADFLRLARDIAWAHHERWDGSGYPRGLRGEEIPLAARIVTVADVYDALTMKRVYKSAYSHSVARGIIIEGSGKHFDPRVVQAFLDIEDNIVQIKDNLLNAEVVNTPLLNEMSMD
jgi:putative two-component system response regulator